MNCHCALANGKEEKNYLSKLDILKLSIFMLSILQPLFFYGIVGHCYQKLFDTNHHCFLKA